MKKSKIKVGINVSKKEIKEYLKKESKKQFKQKWEAFKRFDSCKFERCHIRYMRKKDGLILLRSDTMLDYIQIRLTDKKQFNAIFKVLKYDRIIKINEEK